MYVVVLACLLCCGALASGITGAVKLAKCPDDDTGHCKRNYGIMTGVGWGLSATRRRAAQSGSGGSGT